MTNTDKLIEEVNRYYSDNFECLSSDQPTLSILTNVARHFAEWGAEHTKIDVTDFCKPIDPSIAQCIADHSWEMLGEDEKPVPNDLEEAAGKRLRRVCNLVEETKEDKPLEERLQELKEIRAEKDLDEAAENHIREVVDAAGHPGWDWTTQDIAEAFIAGAKWQAEQLLKSSPLPEDTVLFNKGVEEGKRLMKEEAVEGTVMDFSSNRPRPQVDVLLDPHKYRTGDKVRVIICKKED